MSIDIPEPRYAIGAQIVALIDHQLRYAEITGAYLNAHICYNHTGLSFASEPRWEYTVLVFNQPVEESEVMIIAERTIIAEKRADGG